LVNQHIILKLAQLQFYVYLLILFKQKFYSNIEFLIIKMNNWSLLLLTTQKMS